MAVIAEKMPKRRGPPFLCKHEYLVHKTVAVLKEIQYEEENRYAELLLEKMLRFTNIALDPKTSFDRGDGEEVMKRNPEKCYDRLHSTVLVPNKNTAKYWEIQQKVSRLLNFNTDCRLDQVLLVSY